MLASSFQMIWGDFGGATTEPVLRRADSVTRSEQFFQFGSYRSKSLNFSKNKNGLSDRMQSKILHVSKKMRVTYLWICMRNCVELRNHRYADEVLVQFEIG